MRHSKLVLVLSVLAGALALGEFGTAFTVGTPVFAVVFGLLFLAGALLTRSRWLTAGAVLVGLLCLTEVAEFPHWPKHGLGDWLTGGGFALVSTAGLVVAIMVLAARIRAALARA